jgi:hypothetical protein
MQTTESRIEGIWNDYSNIPGFHAVELRQSRQTLIGLKDSGYGFKYAG